MATERPRTPAQLLDATITALTEAARTGTDWAEFVTLALAGATANIGSVEKILQTRPGSWEAAGIRDLIHSTVGYEDNDLCRHRTTPVRVVVNIDNLLTDFGLWQLYDKAQSELIQRQEAIWTDEPQPAEDAQGTAQTGTELPVTAAEQENALGEIDELMDRLERQRVQDWTAYAEAFTANVTAHATQLGLLVPVTTSTHLDWRGNDPDSGDGNDETTIEYRLWAVARDSTPLPGSGLKPGDYADPYAIPEVETAAGRDPLTRLTQATA